ncbi:hypothetical protein CYMTET_29699, partial [Cymbomonas tetramitiformis]
ELFAIPDYTLGRLNAVNAWLGTSGTVTNLHTDESHNLLTQVAGFKYVRMYAVSEDMYLYPEVKSGNTTTNRFSPIRIDSPDFEKYPLFAQAKYTEVILGPGDMLYMPKGIWHYVRSLSTSFSINFWF